MFFMPTLSVFGYPVFTLLFNVAFQDLAPNVLFVLLIQILDLVFSHILLETF